MNMGKYDLKPKLELTSDRIKIPLELERLEREITVTKETAVNALNTLKELIEQSGLSPQEVIDAFKQSVIVLQGQVLQLNKLEDDLKTFSDNFNLYVNQSIDLQNQILEVQKRAKEREKHTLDLLDKELQSLR